MSKQVPGDISPKPRRAKTPQGRENQMVALAVDLAEKQLRNGTASAQVISHYLKLGTQKEALERERIELENQLLLAKTDQIASQKKVEVLYEEALEAMKTYSGND